jgi:hypothetical protein
VIACRNDSCPSVADVADAGDLSRAARDPVRVRLPVDGRRRLDLPVEDDREALERLLGVLNRPGRRLSAGGQVACDVVELVAARAGELHQDDRALGLREVLAGAVELEVGARHLRCRVLLVVRVVVEEVVVVPGRRRLVHAGAVALADAAVEDDPLLGDAVELEALGERLAGVRLEALPALAQPLLGVLRAENDLLRLRVDEVPLLGRALLGLRLDLLQQLKQVLRRLRKGQQPLLDGSGFPDVGLKVVQPELRGLADQRCGLPGVVDARQLDRDLVGALLADLGLADAELVDAGPHDLHGARHVLVGDLVILRRHGAEHDLEAALKVEAELRLLLERRPRHRQQRHGDESEGRQTEEEEVVTPISHA